VDFRPDAKLEKAEAESADEVVKILEAAAEYYKKVSDS
jgi:hypothetical protein